jgi:hypothetical protein
VNLPPKGFSVQAIAELKKRLVVQLNDRLKEMVLFGSKALWSSLFGD